MKIPVNFYKVLNAPSEPAEANAVYFVLNDEGGVAEAYVTDADGAVFLWGNTDFVTAVMAAAMAVKAPLSSPALTGNPTAPTQTAGNSSTRLATTAFVAAAIAKVLPRLLEFGPDITDDTTIDDTNYLDYLGKMTAVTNTAVITFVDNLPDGFRCSFTGMTGTDADVTFNGDGLDTISMTGKYTIAGSTGGVVHVYKRGSGLYLEGDLTS